MDERIEKILRSEFNDIDPNTVDIIETEYGFIAHSGRHIHALLVYEQHRGQGHGERLVDMVRKEVGSPLMLLCQKGLEQYYEAMGFKTYMTKNEGEFCEMGEGGAVPEGTPERIRQILERDKVLDGE